MIREFASLAVERRTLLRISGLHAAKLFGIDPKAKRQAIKADKLSRLREEYWQDPAPSNTQYGWVWVDEDGKEPTVPVGA